jgi:hypothetical protein
VHKRATIPPGGTVTPQAAGAPLKSLRSDGWGFAQGLDGLLRSRLLFGEAVDVRSGHGGRFLIHWNVSALLQPPHLVCSGTECSALVNVNDFSYADLIC